MVDKVFAADCVHKVIKKINTMPQNLKNMLLPPTPAVAVQWSGMRAELQSSSWGGCRTQSPRGNELTHNKSCSAFPKDQHKHLTSLDN